MNLKKIDRRQVKNQAKLTISSDRKKFIMLNLPAVVITILYFIGVYLTAYTITSTGVTEEALQGSIINIMTPRFEIIMMGIQLFIAMIQNGIQYTSLDYVRDPRTEVKSLRDAFQVFTGKYFVPVIAMWLLTDILIQAGMSLFIVPGIYIYLVLSQQYFIFKDGNSGEQKLGFFSAMLNSGLIVKGYKWDYLILVLSFLGWDILNVFTFGVLSIWLLPYKNLSYAIFYQRLIEVKSK